MKVKLNMQIKLESNKNNYKQEIGYRLLSLQKPKTYCVISAFLKTICVLNSLWKYKQHQIEYLIYNDISCWKIHQFKNLFHSNFIFIFNTVRTGKGNICSRPIIRFQLSSNDAIGFWFLFTAEEGGSIQTLVCIETIFVLNNFKKC